MARRFVKTFLQKSKALFFRNSPPHPPPLPSYVFLDFDISSVLAGWSTAVTKALSVGEISPQMVLYCLLQFFRVRLRGKRDNRRISPDRSRRVHGRLTRIAKSFLAHGRCRTKLPRARGRPKLICAPRTDGPREGLGAAESEREDHN